MRAQNQAHHTIDRLEERSLKEEELDDLSLKGPGGKGGGRGAIVKQKSIVTVSKGMLGKLLRDGMERIWAFPSASIPP